MEQYVKYLRKSRFDRDYAELSVEETLKRHEEILDKMARDRGYYIAKTFREVVSGESIAARPEIQKLLEEVGTGIYAGVLVVDVERLARGNGADQAYISQIFQFSETKIITPSKTYDPSNEFDQEYFEFGLFMSRREYKTINRRLVRGRQSSASEGKYVGSIAPYGYERYKLPDQKGYSLRPLPDEAEVVQKIFEMYTHYAGTKIIANYLNDHKVPTRHGDLWTYSTIAVIIMNPVYMGKIKRGFCKETKYIDEDGSIKKRMKHLMNMEDYDLYDGMHPALVDEEVFLKAQKIRKEKTPKRTVKKDQELQNPFSGLIFCAKCGCRIGRTVGSQKKGARPRFRCVNGRNCHNATADFYLVEEQIMNALREWLDGYKVKIDTVGYADDIAEYQKQLEKLEQEKGKLDQQMENAFNLVEQGIYTLEIFQMRREKLTEAINSIQYQQAEINAAIAELEESESTKTNLIPHTEKLLADYDSMTVEERNDLLKIILHKIEYRRETKGEIFIDLYPRLPRL